jgi:maltose phosphorylase
MYFPFSEEHNVYLQQDGFLRQGIGSRSRFRHKAKESIKNGHGIEFCSPYIKQADVLQCFYFFDHISKEELKFFEF